jgi:hypothetical protein
MSYIAVIGQANLLGGNGQDECRQGAGCGRGCGRKARMSRSSHIIEISI